MNKAVAIPYIIALVIGIIVLVFVVYLFTRQNMGSTISLTECKARLTQICVMCKNENWGSWPDCNSAGDKPIFNVIYNCSIYPEFSEWSSYCYCSDMKKGCKGLGVV